jgi:broad specificity phosphatase PhoE
VAHKERTRMKLYIVRHGETNYNALGLSNDDPQADVHLTERGTVQAREVSDVLRRVPLERIFISELPRTRQTADIINAHHRVPMTVDPRINDRRTGFDGKASELFAAAMRPDPLRTKVNGGESFLEEKERVRSFLDDLRAHPYRAVLIVTHEEIMKIINGICTGMSDAQMWNTEFGNCEVLEFDI